MGKFFESLHHHRGALKWLLFALLAMILTGDFFVERHEVHFFGDRICGFWSLFGLTVCIAMTLVCKGLSHSWLGKDEDYYD